MYLPRCKSSLRQYWPYYLLVMAILILCQRIWADRVPHWESFKAVIDLAHAKNDVARTDDYVRYWLPFMARIHLFVLGCLLVISPWLLGDNPTQVAHASSTTNRNVWPWALVLLAMLSSAILNAPRLGHSLWFDEEATVRRFVVGEVRAVGDELEINVPSWSRTAFFYTDPNNHPLFSLLARASHTLFPPPQTAESFTFLERSVHLPGYILSILGLAAPFWLMSGMGLTRAGVIAVCWLALHPWHVRYGIDARGYSLLFLLIPLTLTGLWRGVHTGRLRWWILFGIGSFLTLWAYPGCLYAILATNLAAVGMIAYSPVDRRVLLGRYIAANILGAVLTSLAYAPCWQLIAPYLRRERSLGEISWVGIAESTCGLFTGIPMSNWRPHELALSLARLWQSSALYVVAIAALLLTAAAAGVLALWRRGAACRMLLLPIFLPFPLLLGVSVLKHNIIHPFYSVTSLPALALLMGCGLDLISRWSRSQWQNTAAAVCALAVFGSFTWPQNQILRRYPIEPMRESVEIMRQQRHPEFGNLKTVLTAHISFTPKVYDPAGVQLKSKEELNKLIARAKAEQLPLYVNTGDPDFARMRYPEIMAVVEDGLLFLALPEFLGTDRQPSRMVYQLR